MLRNLGYIAIVALIALLCSQPTLAQTGLGANHDLTANAVIYTPLAISSPINFSFGNIMVGGNPIVDPKTGGATSIISGSTVGGLKVAGSAAAQVLFTFASSVTLNGPSSNTLIYKPSVTGGDVGAQSSSAILTSGSTAVTLTGGNCQAWVGGELFKSDGTSAVPANQASGTYSGTINLAVDYYQ
ncbi:MAG: DUF4402 domain-containing protein [Bacteroidota bacterium]